MDFLATLLFLQLFLLQHKIRALKLKHIRVPPYIFINERPHLVCSYDLESDILYSVTWYKDDEEFFKYEPKGNVNRILPGVEGVNLKHHSSDGKEVTLEKVSLHTGGVYKCDVIADAFNFPSVQAEAYMEVVVPPNSNPRITGEERIYASGDILTLNCTSDKSYPQARINWFINGAKVNPDSETVVTHQELLLSTVSSLRLELGPNHLAAGQMIVRCESVVATSDRVPDPLIDSRDTQVFGKADMPGPNTLLLAKYSCKCKFQGKAGTPSPNALLLAALLLHRIAHLGDIGGR